MQSQMASSNTQAWPCVTLRKEDSIEPDAAGVNKANPPFLPSFYPLSLF